MKCFNSLLEMRQISCYTIEKWKQEKFQFSIGDAVTLRSPARGQEQTRFNSLLEMRGGPGNRTPRRQEEFQFSIGDALGGSRVVVPSRKVQVSILHWRCHHVRQRVLNQNREDGFNSLLEMLNNSF